MVVYSVISLTKSLPTDVTCLCQKCCNKLCLYVSQDYTKVNFVTDPLVPIPAIILLVNLVFPQFQVRGHRQDKTRSAFLWRGVTLQLFNADTRT